MSSIRSSLDDRSVMVACTWTRPCSIRSLNRTRTTPSGMETSAETSATERRSQTSRTWSAPVAQIDRPSSSLLSSQSCLQGNVNRRLGATGCNRVRANEASRGLRARDVCPMRHQLPRLFTVRPRRRQDASLRLHGPTDSLDQQRHLVADLADVG